MKQPTCPKCGSTRLSLISDGYYRCPDCGYKGTLEMNKEIIKKV